MPGQLMPSLQQSLAQYPNHKEIAATVIGHVQGRKSWPHGNPSSSASRGLELKVIPCSREGFDVTHHSTWHGVTQLTSVGGMNNLGDPEKATRRLGSQVSD
ncbi:t-complex-associated testis expressed 2, isoform CRA_b [Mus musculus]|nr:t-complex-associated testis expressed 2, isoform CRA_b [Mus musculus]